MKKKIIICIVLFLVAIAGAIALFSFSNSDAEKGKDINDFNKIVTEFTWEEFNSLKPSEQIIFQNSFESSEAFEAWMDKVQGNDVGDIPWENGGKQPKEYTWEEFVALEPEEQIIFQNSFESSEAFEAWMDKAQGIDAELPWENGGKQPQNYTWEEFNDLSMSQQMAFQYSFDNIDEFDKWLKKVQKDAE